MKTYNQIDFATAKSQLSVIVSQYITEHKGNFFKNHTFFAFWKKPGIQRAQEMLSSINATDDLQGLLAIVKQEQGKGETLIAALQAKVFALFDVTQDDINEEAQNFTEPAKTMHSGGMRVPPVFIPAKGADHPEVQQKAETAILDKLLALKPEQSYVYQFKPCQLG